MNKTQAGTRLRISGDYGFMQYQGCDFVSIVPIAEERNANRGSIERQAFRAVKVQFDDGSFGLIHPSALTVANSV
jgi:hypothetical protein